MNQVKPDEALRKIEFPLRLTLVGLWAERLCRAFWPLWTIAIAALGALSFGVQDHLPLEADWFAIVSTLVCLVWAAIYGWRSFKRPSRDEAIARLDAALPGRPIAALRDSLALGSADAAAQGVWAAHRQRMAVRAAQARAVEPDLRLASRDPFALRYVALTVLVMALGFGSLWRVATIGQLGTGGASAATPGPSWEGWAAPPAYTGKPTLYLADQTAETLTLPIGTRIQLRFYGEPGALIIAETVSGRTDVPPASQLTQDFTVTQSGRLSIQGSTGREWLVTVLPDSPPGIAPDGAMDRDAEGRFKQPFTATDDYGVVRGDVTIALDLPQVDRRYGLTAAPENLDPVTLDLPIPMKRDRTRVNQTLVDDLSKSLLANLPVTMTFSATDAAGQTAHSQPLHVALPGRRFFDPLAAAIIEMRRDLMWNRANAPRVVQVLKAITNQPDGFIRNQKAYLRLRVAMRDLDAHVANLDDKTRDELTEELWQISLMVEDGDLSSALERLKRAQDRLDEAIRNGASPAEIDGLMKEMRDALDNYMRQQAEQNGKNPDSKTSQNGPAMKLTQDQLQQMLDKLQQLMKEGRTAEAEQLMQQLRDFMNNMKVTQGDGTGSGKGSPGDQAMKDLGQTLRDQQKLSDDSFHDLQNGQDGKQDGNGPGLSDRQKSLRDSLGQMQKGGQLPGAGTQSGQDGQKQLDRAGRAMDDAEKALRQGDLPGALDRQAEALDALRNGIRNFGEAQAQDQQKQSNPQGQASTKDGPRGQRDPLGRETGQSSQMGTDRSMLQGDDVYRRAQDLLDEIRRRAGQQSRPDTERSYLRRLLDLF